jgi:hypothetical protein
MRVHDITQQAHDAAAAFTTMLSTRDQDAPIADLAGPLARLSEAAAQASSLVAAHPSIRDNDLLPTGRRSKGPLTVDRAARVLAVAMGNDCFDRVDNWESLEDWQRDLTELYTRPTHAYPEIERFTSIATALVAAID